jgi:hypothetical protein
VKPCVLCRAEAISSKGVASVAALLRNDKVIWVASLRSPASFAGLKQSQAKGTASTAALSRDNPWFMKPWTRGRPTVFYQHRGSMPSRKRRDCGAPSFMVGLWDQVDLAQANVNVIGLAIVELDSNSPIVTGFKSFCTPVVMVLSSIPIICRTG